MTGGKIDQEDASSHTESCMIIWGGDGVGGCMSWIACHVQSDCVSFVVERGRPRI
jgi:hypothetical protein